MKDNHYICLSIGLKKLSFPSSKELHDLSMANIGSLNCFWDIIIILNLIQIRLVKYKI